MTSEFCNNTVLMIKEIKHAGLQSNPYGSHEERTRFFSLCIKVCERWRVMAQSRPFYTRIFDSTRAISDDQVDTWYRSEDEAITQRWRNDQDISARDATVLRFAGIRFGWHLRTQDDYKERAIALNTITETPSSPPYAPSSPPYAPESPPYTPSSPLEPLFDDDDNDLEYDETTIGYVAPTVNQGSSRRANPKRTFDDILQECCTDEAVANLERDTLKAIKKRKLELAAMTTEKPTCTVCQCEVEAEDQAVIPPCGVKSKCVFHAQCFMRLTCRPLPTPYQCASHKCPNCNSVWNKPNGVSMVKGPTMLMVIQAHKAQAN